MTSLWSDPPDDNCGVCGKPIVGNVDAIYSIPDKNGRFRHYSCWEKTTTVITPKKIQEAHDKLKTSLDNLRTSLRKNGLL